MLKPLKTAIATTALLALASLAASPVLAGGVYKSESGQTTAFFMNQGRSTVLVHYNAKLGSTRITGVAQTRGEANFISGGFSEDLSNGGVCTGRFDAYYQHSDNSYDAIWSIRGGQGCPSVGEEVKVTLYSASYDQYSAMLQDPSNRPLERLNLRDAPNGKIIGYGLSGDIVEVTPESFRGAYGEWYKVRFRDSGAWGFMHGSLVRRNT